MRVIVDTSAYYALCDLDDQYHEPAARVVGELQRAGCGLVTTSCVVLETAQLVGRRLGLTAARRLRRMISAETTVVWVDEALHEAAWDELERVGRRGVSLVDCSLGLVAIAAGITDALAFDPHPKLWGLQLLPR
jgi:uncharacterized protein